MAKQIIGQNSFAYGEIAKTLDGRVDTDVYLSSLDEALNCVITPQGPVDRRNGFKFIEEVKTSSADTRLIKFQFNQSISYMLEFGNLYIRFYTAEAQVLDGGSPYEVVSPFTTAMLPDIQFRQKSNVIYLVHSNVAPRTLTLNSDLTWTLDTLYIESPITIENGYAPATTMTPAATSGLGVNFTAGAATFLAGDVGRQIVNESAGETGVAVIKSITSTTVAVCDIVENFTNTDAIASGDWKMDLSPVSYLVPNGVVQGSVINIRAEYLPGSKATGVSITGITNANPGVVTTGSVHGLLEGDSITFKDIVGMSTLNDKIYTVGTVGSTTTFNIHGEDTSGYTTYSSGGKVYKRLDGLVLPTFRSADVGRYISLNGGQVKILSIVSSSEITALVTKGLNSDEGTALWSIESLLWTLASNNYPKTIGLYNQRLVFGGNYTNPQTIWMSAIGDFSSFGTGPDSEDAISIDIDSNTVNEIQWLAESRDLIIGTSGGELSLSISSSSVIPTVYPRTYYGSDSQQPVNIDTSIIFIQGSKDKIRNFNYDYNIDSYKSEDLTFLIEHLTSVGIEQAVYASSPIGTIYAIDSNGDLLAGTINTSKKVLGWSKFETDGEFKSIQYLEYQNEGQLWAIIERQVDGSTVKYIEVLKVQDGESDTDGFSDSYLTLSNPLTITDINMSTDVFTSTSHGLSPADKVIIKGLVDGYELDLDSDKELISSLNDTSWVVATTPSADTFTLTDLDMSDYNEYISGGYAYKKVSSISGLDHLEGKTVQVKTDGTTHPDEVVSSGAISLDWDAGEVVVGLKYVTRITTKEIPYESNLGPMINQKVRWSNPTLKVYKSHFPLLNGEFTPSRSDADLLGVKLPLYTGNILYGPLQWSTSNAISIESTYPLPISIVSILGSIDSGVV